MCPNTSKRLLRVCRSLVVCYQIWSHTSFSYGTVVVLWHRYARSFVSRSLQWCDNIKYWNTCLISWDVVHCSSFCTLNVNLDGSELDMLLINHHMLLNLLILAIDKKFHGNGFTSLLCRTHGVN